MRNQSLCDRISTLHKPDQDYYLFTECFAFAAALTKMDSSLRLGIIYYGDPKDSFTEYHVVAHDDKRVYDAAGTRKRKNEVRPTNTTVFDLSIAAMEAHLAAAVNQDEMRRALAMMRR